MQKARKLFCRKSSVLSSFINKTRHMCSKKFLRYTISIASPICLIYKQLDNYAFVKLGRSTVMLLFTVLPCCQITLSNWLSCNACQSIMEDRHHSSLSPLSPSFVRRSAFAARSSFSNCSRFADRLSTISHVA